MCAGLRARRTALVSTPKAAPGLLLLRSWVCRAFAARQSVKSVVGVGSGVVADTMIARGMSVGTCRKLLQAVGMLGPAGFLLAAAAADSVDSAVTCFSIGLGLSALTLGGVSVNHLDIAPKNAGLVFGMGNTAGTLGGFLSVALCGVIQEYTGSWPAVLWVLAGHYVVGAGIYTLLASDRVIPEEAT